MAVTSYFVEARKEGRRAEAAVCCPLLQVTREGRMEGTGTKQISPEADRHRAFWRVNNAGSVTCKWNLSTPLGRRKL